MLKKVYILIILGIFLTSVAVFAASPAPGDYTLLDIFNKLTTVDYSASTHNLEPSIGPSVGTMQTLTEIWNAIPPFKTLMAGDLSTGILPAGIYASTTDLSIIEPNLLASNIATGTVLFGVTGTCQGILDSVLGGIAAYYPLDSDVDDYSDNGNNGTSVGATASTSGKVNTAYDFNGLDNYVNLGANKFDNIRNATVVFWYNSLGWTNYSQNIFERYAADNTRLSVSLGFGSGNDHILMCSVVVGGNVQAGVITTDTNCGSEQCYDVWHQGVCQFGDDGMKIYVDGVQGFSDPAITNSFNNITSISNHIGRSMYGPVNVGGRDYFKGLIDEVIIYDRILSEPEILYLYNDGNGQSLLP